MEAALNEGGQVLCVYVHAPDDEAPWQPGGASNWWLHHSLAALDARLRERGAYLLVRRGAAREVIPGLIDEVGADSIYWNRLYDPRLIERDKDVKQALDERGIRVHSFNANLLIEPWQVKTSQGDPYKVFTPYWRNVRAQLRPQPPIPAPKHVPTPKQPDGLEIGQLGLLATNGRDSEFPKHWTPGEDGARALANRLCEQVVTQYAACRDRPDKDGTSKLSAHLHFGEIGPRQLFWQLHEQAATQKLQHLSAAMEPYLRELGWREFSHHLLYHFPHIPEKNLNEKFDAFPWAPEDAESLARWQHGRTGIPIIDAGMRQLRASGWMHNRVRMIVASFLTKNLRQHWLHGARWFWHTLVDADLANNTQGWQWTAGCGADAAPYFRIFNPVTQGRRFDPHGQYVRRWVVELRDIPSDSIHEPWENQELLARTGYPEPLVDLRQSRAAALQAYQRMRASLS